jgi:hypothetical protein
MGVGGAAALACVVIAWAVQLVRAWSALTRWFFQAGRASSLARVAPRSPVYLWARRGHLQPRLVAADRSRDEGHRADGHREVENKVRPDDVTVASHDKGRVGCIKPPARSKQQTASGH